MNLPTIVIALLIFGTVAWIMTARIRTKKAGGSCSCGCTACAGREMCHAAHQKDLL